VVWEGRDEGRADHEALDLLVAVVEGDVQNGNDDNGSENEDDLEPCCGWR
jgi:hypothetical protein